MMKYKLAFSLFFLGSFVFGQKTYNISDYSLVIKGTSNLHNWESTAKEVRASGMITTDAGGLYSIQSLSVVVPVRSIKSTKGSIMDNKTFDALKANTYPTIQYKLERVNGMNQKSGTYDIRTTGDLTIAGTTNKIDLYVQGKVGAGGALTFSGSQKIKMTDYKVKPPTALFGSLTTGDEVEIVFQITLKQN